ncbi:MAG TPA: hypothetical protein VG322_13870 [Candidatus Acidoferrales bacterium]|jgi:hypothetical protein|nr:hypothetical protein [Candidatus Acidoferrales bacterium]
MPGSCHKILTGLLFVSLCVPALRAQQGSSQQGSQQGSGQSSPNQNNSQGQSNEQSTAPIPAYHSPLAGAADQGNDNGEPINVAPDTRAPAGAQDLSLGSPETSRSYWQPHVSLIETGDSDPLFGTANWTSYTSIAGGIDLHKVSGHSDLSLSYLGGGTFSNDGTLGNTVTQELTFSEKVTAGRFKLSVIDSLDYLPEVGFGYGGLGGLGIGGFGVAASGALGLQPGLSPEATILSTSGQQVDNSLITEVDVSLTPRTSITMVGGYSLLRFLDNNLLSVSNYFGQVGYNHQFTREDTIAALYRYNEFSYGGFNQRIRDNSVQLTYARRMTGRLAFQVGAGPDYALFETPVLTSSGGTTSSTELTWSLATSLTYQLKRGSLGLSYGHGVVGGSGVLSGAIGDTLTGTMTRQLTRTTNFGLNGGYSRNTALAIPGLAVYNQNYNYSFGGANVSRPWGRTLNLFLSYQFQHQTSNVGFCIGPSCSSSFTRHIISGGVTWQSRPMLF